jgi:hypothetical protein
MDVISVPLDGRGKSLGFDVTGIGDDTVATVNKQLSYHLGLQKQTDKLFATNYHLAPTAGQDSPVIKVAARNKKKIYGLIETLANIQASGFGPELPLKFVPAVITHRGEMGTDFLSSIEYCANRYKASLRVTPHIDGLTPAKGASNYRRQFKNDLCVQMAKGFGRQLLATVSMSLSASVS